MKKELKERILTNGRTTALGFLGGAVSSAGLAFGCGVTDWRILAGVAGVGAIAGALSKDPDWLKKKAADVLPKPGL